MMTQLPPVGKIKRFFPTHRKCVVKVFLLLVQSMLRCRTVCLYKCRAEVGFILGKKDLNLNTVYTRFIRFFKIKNIDKFCIGIIWIIINLVNFREDVFMLIDRTNWKIGNQNINVFYIGLLLPNGMFIPVLWRLYNKRGNTSEKERCEMMELFFKVWQNHSDIKITILGDREFIGKKWFGFMKTNGFSFIMRARWQDYWGAVSQSLNTTISKTEKKISSKIKRQGYFQAAIILEGEIFYYTVFENRAKRKDKKDKWLVLISDKSDIEWLDESYPKRWKIEVYFYHCKTNGFNMEDLNFVDLRKAQLMMGVVALCYILSVIKGMEHRKTEKIRLIKYGNGLSPSISTFRLGYDNLKSCVHTVEDLIAFILKGLQDSIPIWKSLYWKMVLKSV